MTNDPFHPANLDRDPSPTEPFHAPESQPSGAPAAPLGGPTGGATFELQAPQPVPAQPARRGSSGSRILNLVLGLAIAVAVAGVAFAVGRATAPATASTNGSGTGNGSGTFPGGNFPGRGYFPGGNGGTGNGNGNGGLGGFGGLAIEGTVDSVTTDSVTIKTASGATVTIGLNSDTQYHQATPATASDVAAGKSVVVRVTGGFRQGGNGNGTASLGTASDVTVEP